MMHDIRLRGTLIILDVIYGNEKDIPCVFSFWAEIIGYYCIAVVIHVGILKDNSGCVAQAVVIQAKSYNRRYKKRKENRREWK